MIETLCRRLSTQLLNAAWTHGAQQLVGYAYRSSGENVAEGYTSGAALMASWMTSPPHRANILSAKYTETGVGMARSKSGRVYSVQVFGRPK